MRSNSSKRCVPGWQRERAKTLIIKVFTLLSLEYIDPIMLQRKAIASFRIKLSQDPSSRISAAAGIQEHIRDHLGGTVQVYSWHDLPPTVGDAIEALTQELPT